MKNTNRNENRAGNDMNRAALTDSQMEMVIGGAMYGMGFTGEDNGSWSPRWDDEGYWPITNE